MRKNEECTVTVKTPLIGCLENEENRENEENEEKRKARKIQFYGLLILLL